MSPILAAQGLQKNFGAVTAAADVSLAFERESVVSLIGANGEIGRASCRERV